MRLEGLSLTLGLFACAPGAAGPGALVETWLVARGGALSAPVEPPLALAPGDHLLGFRDSPRALGFEHLDPAAVERPLPKPWLALGVAADGALVPAAPPAGLALPAIDWHRAAEQGLCSRRAADDPDAWALDEACAPPSPTPPTPPTTCDLATSCLTGCVASPDFSDCEDEVLHAGGAGGSVTLRRSRVGWVDLDGGDVHIEDVRADDLDAVGDIVELARVEVTGTIMIPGPFERGRRPIARVVLEDVSAASLQIYDAAEVVLRRVRVASVDTCPRLTLAAGRVTIVDLEASDDGPSTRCSANPLRPAACVFVDRPTRAEPRSLALSRFALRRCNFGLSSYDPGLTVHLASGRFEQVRAAYAVAADAPPADPAPLLEGVILGGAPLFAR